MMFGLNEALMSFIRRQVGLRTDMISTDGSLHAKVSYNTLKPFTPQSFGGNGKDGDVVISANTTISGIKQYRNLTINAGRTLTCQTGTIILVKDTLTVNGLITASGQGGVGGTGGRGDGGQGGSGYGWCGAGGGGGMSYYTSSSWRAGGDGGSTNFTGGIGGAYGSNSHPNGTNGGGTTYQGWGIDVLVRARGAGGGGGGASEKAKYDGGRGGAGGGSLIIEAINLNINSGGAIRADGINGENAPVISSSRNGGAGGGGGGGVLIINCDFYKNYGTVSANGGQGGAGYSSDGDIGGSGGDGGSGLLGIFYRRS